jgi:ABC-type transport system involved in multi-copper enzyme maturation permease subunit
MLKSLAWKEFRELLPLAALALAIEIYLIAGALHLTKLPVVTTTSVIPFVNDPTCTALLWVAAFLAGIAGLWQTVWESSRGTFPFLLHRPMPRRTIFWIKLLIGMLICLIVLGVPVILYSIWAATSGTHASPFEWSMTYWIWSAWLRLPLIYLATFLCGLRPARWFGSRMFPLGAAIVAVILSEVLYQTYTWAFPILWAAALATFLVVIFHVARTRDFS